MPQVTMPLLEVPVVPGGIEAVFPGHAGGNAGGKAGGKTASKAAGKPGGKPGGKAGGNNKDRAKGPGTKW